MHRTLLAGALIAGIWGAPVCAQEEPTTQTAADTAAVEEGAPPVEPLFTSPKQIQVSLGRFAAKEADVVLLPQMQIQWAVRNKVTATGGAFRKHKSSKEIVAPLDAALLERVLLALQDDLAARFESAGWNAVTRTELGADVPELQTLKRDEGLGVATHRYNDGHHDQDWAVVALPGSLPPNPKSIGNGMAWNRFLKGKSGFNLNVTYSFAAGTVGETQSRQLGTEAGGGLWFSARTDLIGASSGGWGNIIVDPAGLIVDPDVGTLAELSGSKSGAAENVVRFLGGMGSRDRQGYEITPDWAKVEQAMLRAGRAYNAELVDRLTRRG